jgi:hypothetical protein
MEDKRTNTRTLNFWDEETMLNLTHREDKVKRDLKAALNTKPYTH